MTREGKGSNAAHNIVPVLVYGRSVCVGFPRGIVLPQSAERCRKGSASASLYSKRKCWVPEVSKQGRVRQRSYESKTGWLWMKARRRDKKFRPVFLWRHLQLVAVWRPSSFMQLSKEDGVYKRTLQRQAFHGDWVMCKRNMCDEGDINKTHVYNDGTSRSNRTR